MTSFGEKIKEARKEKNLTQNQLAEKLGVTRGAVALWEQGKAQPAKDNIPGIEDVLGLVLRIGPWLERKRLEMNMSVSELWKKSDVSIPTIYNIEQGKIENPRETTVEKLEKVLKDEVPTEIKEASAEVSRVEGLGSLQDFSPHEPDEWPDAPGIYLFYDVSQRLVYVGQSENIKNRLGNYARNVWWFRKPTVEYASFIEIGDKETRKQIESILIKSLKSNAVHNYKETESFK